MNIASKIKELRKKKKITQRELAKILNVAPATVAMWETNKNQPDAETLVKLANIFEITTDFILNNDETPKKPNPKENHITIIGRGGLIKEYDLPPENVAALETILENLKNKED